MMDVKKVQVELPPDIYHNLKQIAEASGWSLNDVIVQAVKTGSPPNLSKVPHEFHDELMELNKLNDRDLLRLVEGKLPDPKGLDEQHRRADFVTLRRTYALFLLRWRGHPVPKAYEALITS